MDFIALKNPSRPRLGLNPRTLGPMASTVTTRPQGLRRTGGKGSGMNRIGLSCKQTAAGKYLISIMPSSGT
jgi:hypothetical protein